MEDFRLTAMRQAAQAVERWRKDWGHDDARSLVLEHIIGVYDMPKFRDAYLTAFGL